MKHADGCNCSDHRHEHFHDTGDVGNAESEHTTDLPEVYCGRGVQFCYPRSWTVDEESSPEQTTITVQSPGTAYWTVSLFEDRPEPERVATSVLSAYRDSYPDLDVDEKDVQILGTPVLARELDFLCLDLVTTASLVVFQTLSRTVLVTFQGEDRELETTRPLLESITRSLVCDLE